MPPTEVSDQLPQTCDATWYTDTETASGEPFDPNALTAAHRTLPFGTMVRVTRLETGASVVVRINDRGPFDNPGACIDLTPAAFSTLAPPDVGRIHCRLDSAETPPPPTDLTVLFDEVPSGQGAVRVVSLPQGTTKTAGFLANKDFGGKVTLLVAECGVNGYFTPVTVQVPPTSGSMQAVVVWQQPHTCVGFSILRQNDTSATGTHDTPVGWQAS
jgi:hypothetical protein